MSDPYGYAAEAHWFYAGPLQDDDGEDDGADGSRTAKESDGPGTDRGERGVAER